MAGTFYTGIGSRQTPISVLNGIREVAKSLQAKGYILRSGGADGADSAFEWGVEDLNKEIYLPWKGFNNNSSNLYLDNMPNVQEAYELAEAFHPAWHRCNEVAKKFHARNCYQVLGCQLSPKTASDFIICWTPNREFVAERDYRLRIANAYNVPIMFF